MTCCHYDLYIILDFILLHHSCCYSALKGIGITVRVGRSTLRGLPFVTSGILRASPSFIALAQVGGAPGGGRNTQVDYCRFYAFIIAVLFIFFFIELLYRSDSVRETLFFAPQGRDPISRHAFLWLSRYEFIILEARAKRG